MKIKVKILKGQEITIEVSQTEPVLAVKRVVAQQMDVPVEAQRLVFKGKTLTDSGCLHDHGVKEGDKIHLFVKKTAEIKPTTAERDFWHHLRMLLKNHFTEADVEKVIHKSKEDFDVWVKQLSLDDIERMAKVHLDEQASNR
ncbi:ubiquitin-like protein 4A [Exaiptasia diaphana]|uniref:Ubiquitin-like domain-containing protein n=1 Tax=Exaiptasia diaphana TaxID=2652724 RepID=A0A913X946_EXADI|nr:ubiquitin-like protein 4A [Exaiptasia diaphana]KXJ14373.1 Ubiquitin-like protein 4A [Exaiptasia diaphana]